MSNFLIGCALGVLVTAFIAAPFLAPWSVRVRYLATAPMADPWTGLAPAPAARLRVVTLTGVHADSGRVRVGVEEIGNGHRAPGCSLLSLGSCLPGVVAELDGWAVLRTPLLMEIEGREAHLFGPDGDVVDLVVAEERLG